MVVVAVAVVVAVSVVVVVEALGAALSARRRIKRDRNVSKLGFLPNWLFQTFPPNTISIYPVKIASMAFLHTQFRISRFDRKITHLSPFLPQKQLSSIYLLRGTLQYIFFK